jgi:hypothetical protein
MGGEHGRIMDVQQRLGREGRKAAEADGNPDRLVILGWHMAFTPPASDRGCYDSWSLEEE